MRAIVYYFYKITKLELNYDIYDKELLVVIKTLKKWRVYLKRTISLV